MRTLKSLFAASVALVVMVAGAQVSSAATVSTQANGADNQITHELQAAKANVDNGQRVLAAEVNGIEILVSKNGGATHAEAVLPAHSSTADGIATLPRQGLGEPGQPVVTPQFWGCSIVAYSVTSVIWAMGAATLISLAIAFPEGVTIAGFFFSSTQLALLAGAFGAYGTLYTVVHNIIC